MLQPQRQKHHRRADGVAAGGMLGGLLVLQNGARYLLPHPLGGGIGNQFVGNGMPNAHRCRDRGQVESPRSSMRYGLAIGAQPAGDRDARHALGVQTGQRKGIRCAVGHAPHAVPLDCELVQHGCHEFVPRCGTTHPGDGDQLNALGTRRHVPGLAHRRRSDAAVMQQHRESSRCAVQLVVHASGDRHAKRPAWIISSRGTTLMRSRPAASPSDTSCASSRSQSCQVV